MSQKFDAELDEATLEQYRIWVALYVLRVDKRELEYAFVGFEGYESRIHYSGSYIFVVTAPDIYEAAKRRVQDQPGTDKLPMSYTPERPMLLIRPRR